MISWLGSSKECTMGKDSLSASYCCSPRPMTHFFASVVCHRKVTWLDEVQSGVNTIFLIVCKDTGRPKRGQHVWLLLWVESARWVSLVTGIWSGTVFQRGHCRSCLTRANSRHFPWHAESGSQLSPWIRLSLQNAQAARNRKAPGSGLFIIKREVLS